MPKLKLTKVQTGLYVTELPDEKVLEVKRKLVNHKFVGQWLVVIDGIVVDRYTSGPNARAKAQRIFDGYKETSA